MYPFLGTACTRRPANRGLFIPPFTAFDSAVNPLLSTWEARMHFYILQTCARLPCVQVHSYAGRLGDKY